MFYKVCSCYFEARKEGPIIFLLFIYSETGSDVFQASTELAIYLKMTWTFVLPASISTAPSTCQTCAFVEHYKQDYRHVPTSLFYEVVRTQATQALCQLRNLWCFLEIKYLRAGQLSSHFSGSLHICFTFNVQESYLYLVVRRGNSTFTLPLSRNILI